jgi:hypothetical protein
MNPAGSRRRVVAGLALGLLVGVIFTGGWALPNVAGAMFVHVRAVVTPVGSTSGPQVTVASGQPVQAGSIAVSVEVENSYPLTVVIGADPVAYTASIYARGSDGKLGLIWHTGSGDAVAEEGSDSPVGGGSAQGAVSVPPGVTRHDVATGSDAFGLIRPTGSIASGIYYVRVWAYGIASPLVPISIDGGS